MQKQINLKYKKIFLTKDYLISWVFLFSEMIYDQRYPYKYKSNAFISAK